MNQTPTTDGSLVNRQIRHYNPTLFRPRKTCVDFFHYPTDKKLGEGTYGIVYKGWDKGANNRQEVPEYAIKEMKRPADPQLAKLSVSACREIMLLRELSHENIVWASDIFPDQNLQIFIVFEYAAYDLQKLILHHRSLKEKGPGWEISENTVKSIMWQMLNGLNYMHTNWVLHRDLKPQNILITGHGPQRGRVKIADLGMARIFKNPLKPLVDIDHVVVTIWYRAPEILLGSMHYTTAIDIWSLGCIFGELITTRPLFHVQHGQPETKVHQREQVKKIFDIMGLPNNEVLMKVKDTASVVQEVGGQSKKLYGIIQKYSNCQETLQIYDLLVHLLNMNPACRIPAKEALRGLYFTQGGATFSRSNCFDGLGIHYPETPKDSQRSSQSRQAQASHGSKTRSQALSGHRAKPPSKKRKI